MIYATTIIDYLKNLAKNHTLVNQVGYGSLFDLNGLKDKKYPIVWFILNSIMDDKRIKKYNIQMIVGDRLYKDSTTNELDVLATTESISNDIIELIRKDLDEMDINIDGVVQMVDFFEEFNDDNIAGWLVTFTLVAAKPLDRCGIFNNASFSYGVNEFPNPHK